MENEIENTENMTEMTETGNEIWVPMTANSENMDDLENIMVNIENSTNLDEVHAVMVMIDNYCEKWGPYHDELNQILENHCVEFNISLHE